ncbi:hypothetical protein GCM10027020_05800 [Nocardioides salsibiostraticola]
MGFLAVTALLLPLGLVVAAATRRYVIAAALGTLTATGVVFVSTVVLLVATDALPFLVDTPPAPWAYPLLYGLTGLTFVGGALLTATKARRAEKQQRLATFRPA